MQILSGLATLANLILSLMVGARLLRLAQRHRTGPELGLGVYFLVAIVCSGTLQIAVYSGWGDPNLQMAPDLAARLNTVAAVLQIVGMAGLYVFLWRTFRPNDRGAPIAVLAGCAVMLLGFVWQAATDGFGIRVWPGPGYWTLFLGRMAPAIWMAFESFSWHRRMRRQVLVGIGDPLVANRFGLWAAWSVTTLLTVWSEVAARGAYIWITGDREVFDPVVGQPVIQVTIAVTMVLSCASALLLYLTFFAPEWYRRRVTERAGARAAATSA